MADARLAGPGGDTPNTPATDKWDTLVGVAEAAQDSTDSTRGAGFLVLLAMDHCHVEFRCTPDKNTVRLAAATVDEKKQVDETRVPDGTCVPGVVSVVDNPGSMGRVHRKEGKVLEGEDLR